jgi:hypothetical protein
MNIIKFPEPQKKLSEEEEIEIARQEILADPPCQSSCPVFFSQ